MTAITVLGVEQGWAGDRKRHLVAALVTTDYTVTPEQVGLNHIEAIVQNGIRLGTVTVGTTSVVLTNAAITASYGTSACTLYTATADANVLLYFYGW